MPYVDLHCHILPGLDDGARTFADAVHFARLLDREDVLDVATTSHIKRAHFPEIDIFELDGRRQELQQAIRAEGLKVTLHPGGELAHEDALALHDRELQLIAQGPRHAQWLLLECPLAPGAPTMEPVVAALRRRGLEILLAHPERSPGFMRSPAALERLLGLGALTQLTSTAFSGRFGDTVRKVAFEMLERGHGHVIASDGHGADGRPPDLLCALEAFERRYEDPRELFDWMTVGVPGAIVAGEPPPPRPPMPKKRGLLRRFTS